MKALFFILAASVGGTVEERLARIEEKLDRLERLLDAVFGDEFKRVEELQRTPGLLDAVRDVERRHEVRGIKEALVAAGSEKMRNLQGSLIRAMNRSDPARLKEDASFRLVLVEVMCRMQAEGGPGGHTAKMIARRDPALLASCLPDLFGRPDGTETALQAALYAEGPEVARMVRAQLPLLTEPREVVMARAALLAQGEEGALEGLRGDLKAMNDDELLHQLALALRDVGSPAALWFYLELFKSERLHIMAAREFSRLRGEKGRPDPLKVRSERMQLYEQHSAWLDENYSRIRFDKTRRRFVLQAGDP